MQTPRETLSVNLPSPEAIAFREYAKARRLSVNALLREAVAERLAEARGA